MIVMRALKMYGYLRIQAGECVIHSSPSALTDGHIAEHAFIDFDVCFLHHRRLEDIR